MPSSSGQPKCWHSGSGGKGSLTAVAGFLSSGNTLATLQPLAVPAVSHLSPPL